MSELENAAGQFWGVLPQNKKLLKRDEPKSESAWTQVTAISCKGPARNSICWNNEPRAKCQRLRNYHHHTNFVGSCKLVAAYETGCGNLGECFIVAAKRQWCDLDCAFMHCCLPCFAQCGFRCASHAFAFAAHQITT